MQAIKAGRCIIDGELLVWDRYEQRFEDFGRLKARAHGVTLLLIRQRPLHRVPSLPPSCPPPPLPSPLL